MKLSLETVKILKNFASIHQGAIIKKGNILMTSDQNENIFSKAIVADKFPVDFAVYDLNEFLGILSLYDDYSLDFHDEYVTITESVDSTKFYYSSEKVIGINPEEFKLNLTNPDKSFILDQQTLKRLLKYSDIMKLSDLMVSEKGLLLFNKSDPNGNNHLIDIDVNINDDSKGDEVTSIFEIKGMKLLPLSYTVNISNKGIAHFKSMDEDYNIEYYLTLSYND